MRPSGAGPLYVVRLDDLAAAGYPGLRRAQVVTVYRPWSWRHPLLSLLAARIRAYSSRISGHHATESHAMIYAGGGWCWSQDSRFELVHIRSYRGCVLSFWDQEDRTWEQRNRLMGDCAPHQASEYGYRDILALALFALTGERAWLRALGDPDHWICSEAVCWLVRQSVDHGYGGPMSDCLRTPQQLADWMVAQNWRRVCLEVI